MRIPSSTLVLSAVLLALFAAPASAHVPPGEYGSFAAGFTHPFFGLDHILAMVAVGLWAGFLGGRAMWIVPAAFVGVMLAGFVMALLYLPLPLVEPMILASTIVLGLVVALAVRLDIRLCAALVGVFALFHGHAHGGELGAAGAVEFGLGFLLATGLLHAAGVGLGLLVSRLGEKKGALLSRGLGVVTAFAGVYLVVG